MRRGEVVNQSASAGAMGVGRQVMSACDGWQLMSCERMRRKADAKRQHISVLRRLVCDGVCVVRLRCIATVKCVTTLSLRPFSLSPASTASAEACGRVPF